MYGHWRRGQSVPAFLIHPHFAKIADKWLDEQRTQVELFPTRLAEGAHLRAHPVGLSSGQSVGTLNTYSFAKNGTALGISDYFCQPPASVSELSLLGLTHAT